jgi:hypothetical protein
MGVAAVHHRHLGHDPPEGHVPFDRVVAPRLPRVDQHRLPRAAWVALLEQEAMPAEQRPQQRAGAYLIGVRLEQQAHTGRRDGRLSNAGDAATVDAEALAPPARAGQVARVGPGDRCQQSAEPAVDPVGHAGVEGDVGDHALAVPRSRERLELGPRPRRVELRPAERGERRVPVPLVRVGGARRHRIAAVVVAAKHGRGECSKVTGQEGDHVAGRVFISGSVADDRHPWGGRSHGD